MQQQKYKLTSKYANSFHAAFMRNVCNIANNNNILNLYYTTTTKMHWTSSRATLKQYKNDYISVNCRYSNAQKAIKQNKRKRMKRNHNNEEILHKTKPVFLDNDFFHLGVHTTKKNHFTILSVCVEFDRDCIILCAFDRWSCVWTMCYAQ